MSSISENSTFYTRYDGPKLRSKKKTSTPKMYWNRGQYGTKFFCPLFFQKISGHPTHIEQFLYEFMTKILGIRYIKIIYDLNVCCQPKHFRGHWSNTK